MRAALRLGGGDSMMSAGSRRTAREVPCLCSDRQPTFTTARSLTRRPLPSVTHPVPVPPEILRFLVDAQRSVREYSVGRRRREVAAVSWMWAVLVGGVTPIIAALCRNLVLLWGDSLRRASIERIIRDRTGAIRIVDHTAEGDVLEIEVLPSHEGEPGPDLRSEGP